MEKIDTLIMALSCDAPFARARREACLETWMNTRYCSNISFVFVVGRPGQPSSLCGDILYVDAPDTYVGLPVKTWAAIRESLVRWDYHWLFKCDDDTLVHPLRVQCYPRTADYMGRKAALNGDDPDWHRKYVSRKEQVGTFDEMHAHAVAMGTRWIGPWANGGSGYFLSRVAAKMVAAEPVVHAQRELYEDKFVGDVMISNGIYLHGAHSTLRHKIDVGSRLHLVGATTLHPLEPNEMREVYWKLLRSEEIGT